MAANAWERLWRGLRRAGRTMCGSRAREARAAKGARPWPASRAGPFDPATVPGQFPPGTDERIDQFIYLAEVLGHRPQPGQRPGQAFGEGVKDVRGGLAD